MKRYMLTARAYIDDHLRDAGYIVERPDDEVVTDKHLQLVEEDGVAVDQPSADVVAQVPQPFEPNPRPIPEDPLPPEPIPEPELVSPEADG